MSKFIYLYGRGETKSSTSNSKSKASNQKGKPQEDVEMAQLPYFVGIENISTEEGCYLKCEIPDPANLPMSGFFPSVLHAYMMYAKDIGLKVTDVFYDGSFDLDELYLQLVYSLWPLFYVNNSNLFTNVDSPGLNVWRVNKQTKTKLSTELSTCIKLDTHSSVFYHDTPIDHQTKDWIVNANEAALPIPVPGSLVNSNGPWFLLLALPEKGTGNASTFAIIQHYNALVVWNTLLDMQKNVSKEKTAKKYQGLKQATGAVIKAVMERPYAYDQMMPLWNPSWGDEPPYYQAQSLSINDYNIGASFFVSEKGQDPSVAELKMLCTALNIKGKVKSGHAETRLLLTLDAVDNANMQTSYVGSRWFEDVCDFYDFNVDKVEVSSIYYYYFKKNISLISSLKPCYLCAGEVDATVDGFIRRINDKVIDMWACFPYLQYKPKIKKVLYFDVDRPISYPSYLRTSVYVDGMDRYDWEFYLAPWVQWAAFLNGQPEFYQLATSPIGPRVVEPAGECLKTGEAYNRYKNSERLLLSSQSEYLEELQNLLSGIGFDVEVDDYE
ncbi:MAG: hypothetical protein R3E90_11235 [Marinicella sp.]|nr:hypothetical protein [Xanthomonadales bacterium]